MAGWVASLSAADFDNWEICKRHNLFGGRTTRLASIAAGDRLYFWSSGRGVFATATATAPSDRVSAGNLSLVPWPHPDSYKYIVPITDIREARPDAPKNWTQFRKLTEAEDIPLPSLPRVPERSFARIDAFFDSRPVDLDQEPSEDDLRNAWANDIELNFDAGDEAAREYLGLLDIPVDQDERQSALRAVVVRRGQPQFRAQLLARYQKCLVTQSAFPAVLEACHISPYRGDRSNHLRNGLLLRADIHTLFDLNLLTITPDFAVRLAPDLEATAYGELGRTKVGFPAGEDLRPDARMLERHNENCAWL